jgi:chromosome segregation ATPase
MQFQKKYQPNEIDLAPLKAAIGAKQKELDELAKQKSNLHDLLERGHYDYDTFMERQSSVVERMNKFEEEIRLLKEEIQKEEMKEKNSKEFVPAVKKVIEAYRHTDDVEKKNRLLKSILEKATYLRKKEWTKRDQFVIQVSLKI